MVLNGKSSRMTQMPSAIFAIAMLEKYKKSDMTLFLRSCITDVMQYCNICNITDLAIQMQYLNIWRFEAAWPYICRADYRTAMDKSFTANAVSDVKDDVLAFANNQLLAT